MAALDRQAPDPSGGTTMLAKAISAIESLALSELRRRRHQKTNAEFQEHLGVARGGGLLHGTR
jgi:hypothetical protein